MMSGMTDERPMPPMSANFQDLRDEIETPGTSMTADNERGGYALVCIGCHAEIGFCTYDWINAELAKLPPGTPTYMIMWQHPSHRDCPHAIWGEPDDDETCEP